MSGLHTTADSYTFFFFNDTATTEIYTLSLHDALPISTTLACQRACKQLDRLDSQIVALKNRLEATDRFAWPGLDRKSTRLNSSHANISYAVFCLKKKKSSSYREPHFVQTAYSLYNA